jgi:hypothetical protein
MAIKKQPFSKRFVFLIFFVSSWFKWIANLAAADTNCTAADYSAKAAAVVSFQRT